MRSARPARHGSATGFLSNPIATRWNSCSARHGDAPASSYSISSWILLRHGLALPSLFSSRARLCPGTLFSFIRSSSRSASILISSGRPYFEETDRLINSSGSCFGMRISSHQSLPSFRNCSTARTYAMFFDER